MLAQRKPDYFDAEQQENGSWKVTRIADQSSTTMSDETFRATFDEVNERKRGQGIRHVETEITEVLQNNDVPGQKETETDSGGETTSG